MSQAIRQTKAERMALWSWQTLAVCAQYSALVKHEPGSMDDDALDLGADGTVNGGNSGNGRTTRNARRKRVASPKPRVQLGATVPGKTASKRVRPAPGKPATHTSTGFKFCEDFNAKAGGCSNGTKCRKAHPEVHGCNVVDGDGKICGRMNKRRCDHPH